uniref:Odorant receptor n=1 Tax=Aulacocentrum confusum TaxID=2767324 RepID=A0A7G8Z977_9HYME|nr:olfactory receptor 58 [Aulacocentrum confusum]
MLLMLSIDLVRQLIIYENCGTVIEIVDILTIIISALIVIIKVVQHYIYKNTLNIMIRSSASDWTVVNNCESRHIMLRYANIGRIFFIVQTVFAYTAGFQIIVGQLPFLSVFSSKQISVNESVWNFPVGLKCWIPVDKSAWSYGASYLIQSIQVIIISGGSSGCDAIFFGIAMHICGQYELLHQSLGELYGSGTIRVPSKSIVREFVKRHEHLLTLSDYFEMVYNPVILAIVVSNAVLLCITGLVLLISLQSGGNIVTMLGLTVRIYLLLVQLFICSYVGERLSQQSLELGNAVYNSAWYELPPIVANDMVFIILRCTHQVNLTAGNLFVMNIYQFMQMLKTMFSYFSVLRLAFNVKPQ